MNAIKQAIYHLFLAVISSLETKMALVRYGVELQNQTMNNYHQQIRKEFKTVIINPL